jgi:hypothetical protein
MLILKSSLKLAFCDFSISNVMKLRFDCGYVKLIVFKLFQSMFKFSAKFLKYEVFSTYSSIIYILRVPDYRA